MSVNNEWERTLNFINKLIDVEFGNVWKGFGHGLFKHFLRKIEFTNSSVGSAVLREFSFLTTLLSEYGNSSFTVTQE
jgi:hypothetical protein